jgi:hypothetical protein
MEEKRNAYSALVWKLVGKRPLGKPRHGWRIALKRILKKHVERTWTGFFWPTIGTTGWLLST